MKNKRIQPYSIILMVIAFLVCGCSNKDIKLNGVNQTESRKEVSSIELSEIEENTELENTNLEEMESKEIEFEETESEEIGDKKIGSEETELEKIESEEIETEETALEEKATEKTEWGEIESEETNPEKTESENKNSTNTEQNENYKETCSVEIVSTYTVIFEDYDGTVLKVEKIGANQDATLPANPVRSGYVFAGWQGNYQNVIADSKVVATYVSDTAPNLFVIESSNIREGRVSVIVRLIGNIYTCGIECKLDYDENVLKYVNMIKHNSVEANNVNLYNNKQVVIVWAGTENMTNDTIQDEGILLEIIFQVLDTDCFDTVLSFNAEHMCIHVVDDDGNYKNGQFTVTKGMVQLK